MSTLEEIGALHKSLSAPESSIESVTYSDDPWREKRISGIRAPGTGFPYLIMLGTLRTFRSKSMCAIYKRDMATIVTFKDGPYKSWIATGKFLDD